MSDSVFPALPGLGWPIRRTVLAPPVRMRTTPSQREFRWRDHTVARYQFTLPFDFLRSASAASEWQTLVGFYNARGGSYDDFLFVDSTDASVVAQAFGVGDGTTTAWQLVRTLGAVAEPVYGIVAAPKIFKNGVEQVSGLTVNARGLVTFAAAPASGVALTWTGAFAWRCRFLRGELEFENFARDFWSAAKVELLTLLP